MTWRYFLREELVEGELHHILDCEHPVRGRHRQDGVPVQRRWCPACWKVAPAWVPPQTVTLSVPVDHARWLHTILAAGLKREDYVRVDLAEDVLSRLKKVLG